MKIFIFILVALLITVPWFIHPGYLLLLDWSGGNTIGNSDWAQKITVTLMLILAGTCTSILASYLINSTVPRRINRIISIASGIFAMVNPFVFNRLEMGHINLLFGYALTPLVVFFVLRFFTHPSHKNALIASFLACLVLVISIHFIILLPLILLAFVLARNDTGKINANLYALLLVPFLFTAIVIAGISFFNPSSQLPAFTSADLVVFAPHPQCTSNIIVDTVLLVAQWRTAPLSPVPCTQLSLFLIVHMLLLFYISIGAWKHKKLALAAIAFIVFADIPFILAMRDSAKYIADLAIIEVILLAYGTAYLYEKTKKNMFPFAALLLVALSGIPMLWGLSHTIIPKQYPASWYIWNTQLSTLSQRPRVLFLPWHLYMPFDFTNQVTIANPAQNFFTNADIIQGDNLEMRQGNVFIESESHQKISQEVQQTLSEIHSSHFSDRLQLLLTNEHIQYIALASGSSEESLYISTLNTLQYLHLSYTAPGLTVWKYEKNW